MAVDIKNEIDEKVVADKKKRVKKELTKLNKIFAAIPDDRKTVAEGLINRVAFMQIELEDLEKRIQEEGPINVYNNGGGQSGVKPSAAVQTYNNLQKSYTAAVKVLLSELDNGNSKADTKDKLADFLLKKK